MRYVSHIKRKIKKFIFKLSDILFPSRKKIENILWLFVGNGYGDIFVSLYMPREIKKTARSAKITMVGSQKVINFFSKYGYIDEFIDRNDIRNDICVNISYKTVFFLIRLILKTRPDLLIVWPEWCPAFLITLFRMAGAGKIIAFGDSAFSSNTVVFKEENREYIRNIANSIIMDAGNDSPDTSFSFQIDSEYIRNADEILNSVNPDKLPIIMFNPESNDPQRTLLLNNVIETVKCLHIRFPEYFILIPRYNEKKIYLSHKYTAMPEVKNIDLLIALMEKADAVISVDTSTVHMADILSKPLVALYSALYDTEGNILNPPKMTWRSPRSSTVSLYSDNINDITPKKIVEAMAESLERTKAALR